MVVKFIYHVDDWDRDSLQFNFSSQSSSVLAKINKTKYCESQTSHRYLHLLKKQLEKFISTIYIPIQKMMKKCFHFYFRRLHPLKERDQLKKGEQIYYKQREHERWLGMKHNGAKISWGLIKYNRICNCNSLKFLAVSAKLGILP